MPLIAEKMMLRRGTALRRRILWANQNGQIVAKAWPRPSEGPTSQETLDWRKFFRLTQRAFAYAHQRERLFYVQLSRSGPWLPRDWWTSALYRRLFWLETPDATIYPVEGFLMTQRNLDYIAQAPGSMVARGPDEWVGVPPGPLGNVLTSMGAGTPPAWQPAGGGGGGGWEPLSVAPIEKATDFSNQQITEDAAGKTVMLWESNSTVRTACVKGISAMSGNVARIQCDYSGKSNSTRWLRIGIWWPADNTWSGLQKTMVQTNNSLLINPAWGVGGIENVTTTTPQTPLWMHSPYIVELEFEGTNLVARIGTVLGHLLEIWTHFDVGLRPGPRYPFIGFKSNNPTDNVRVVNIQGFEYG